MTEPSLSAVAGSITASESPAGRDLSRIRLGPAAAGCCRRRIHLDAANADQRTPATGPVIRAMEELSEHREQLLQIVRNAHGLTADPAGQERPAIVSQGPRTAPREPIVVSPNLTIGTRAGSPDVLVWAGDGYLPVIIRAHRTRDAGTGARCAPLARPMDVQPDPTHRARRNRSDRLALAHHYRQLVELGWASAMAMGGVIGRGSPTDGAGRRTSIGSEDDAAVIVWQHLDTGDPSTLEDYERRFDDRLAIARAAVGGQPLAFPSRVAECRRCQWWPRCSTELRAVGDISLLLTGDDVPIARAAGIDTIGALADLPSKRMGELTRALSRPAQLRVRARAWQRGILLVRRSSLTTIRRADVEIDVDAESYGEEGAYLWGAALSGADVGISPGFRPFVTWAHLPSPEQGTVFGAFFDHLQQVRTAAADRGLSFAVFCYGKAAEERWMLGLARRYAGLPGVPAEREVAAFCRSPHWVDLMLEIGGQFVLPGSLRLKELAGSVGFGWRDPEPGGENSMAWYRAAVGLDTGSKDQQSAPDNPMATRILRYNEDDVLATLALRRWLTTHLAELPTVADLEEVEIEGEGLEGVSVEGVGLEGGPEGSARRHPQ